MPSPKRPEAIYAARVTLGAYYTDGVRLMEVSRVDDLGYIQLRDTCSNQILGLGIAAFRRQWWLVKSS